MKAKAECPALCSAALVLEGVLSFARESADWSVRKGWFGSHHTPVSQVPVQVPGQIGN